MFAPLLPHEDDHPIRMALVEKQTLIREGLFALVTQTTNLECVAVAGDHVEAVRQAEFARPDVALIDLSPGGSLGRVGLRLWRERLPDVGLLLFDDLIRDANVQLVLKGCGLGYVTKCDSFTDLVEAIRSCSRGEITFTPQLRPRLRATAHGWELLPVDGNPGIHCLTSRETEVLVYLAQGLSGKQCSEMLGISPSTVDNHKSRIMRKLRIRKTVDLTRLALKEGLVPR